MDNVFLLRCAQCGLEYDADSIVPGNMPVCECGSVLHAPGHLVFYCDKCKMESDPAVVSLESAVLCPGCGVPVKAVRQFPAEKPAAAVKPPVSSVKAMDKTIGLATGLKIPKTAEKAAAANKTVVLGDTEIGELAKHGINKAAGTNAIFGKYKVLSEIARGGMGIIYKIYDPALKRELALKLMLQGEGATEVAIKRFMLEARAAANLKHPNIIAVHEMGEIDGQFYFTMDFIEGCSFQDIFLSDRRMPENVFIQHMTAVCSALEAAHNQGIIHRDLKPANIMLEKQTNRVVLMDFGLAKDTSSMSIQSITGAVFGSPAYMSPEQAQGQTHEIDHRCDIYSMGVILYEGLTGKKPFHGETAFETISMVVNNEPVRPHTVAPGAVSKDMENIILRCMEKDPDRRYQKIQGLKNDLLAYLKGDSVAARPVPLPVRFWRKARRRPVMLGLVAGSPLIVAAGIAGWLIFSGPSYLEMAEDAINSGDATRQAGAIKDLVVRMNQNKIKKTEQREAALKLFRKSYFSGSETVAAAIGASVKFCDEKAIPDLLTVAASSKATDANRAAALNGTAILESVKKTGNQDYAHRIISIAADDNTPLAVRIEAVKALNFFIAADIVPTLLKIAENQNLPSALRVLAIEMLGNRISLINPSMKNILELYADDNREVAQAAAKALVKIREPGQVLSFYGIKDAVSKVYGKIGDIKLQEAERNRRVMELIDDTPDSSRQKQLTPLEAMLKKLHSQDAGERAAAAYDLGQLGDGKAVPELVRSLTDSDNNVRRVSSRSVILLAPKQAPDLAHIRSLLNNPELLIREQSVYILSELKDSSSIPELIALSGREESPRVQAELARSLGRSGDAAALPALKNLFIRCRENSFSTAMACLKAMTRFEKPALPFLINLLETKDRDLNSAVVTSLKEISGEDFGNNQSKWTAWLKKQN
ncbi:MAG: protein kinase domain-containing protein [Victivallaceae bacterium]